MNDPDYYEGRIDADVKDLVIDIGEDGGELTITTSDPQAYMINGREVNEAAAYAWVRHWHALVDDAMNPPGPGCICNPCQMTRELHR